MPKKGHMRTKFPITRIFVENLRLEVMKKCLNYTMKTNLKMALIVKKNQKIFLA